MHSAVLNQPYSLHATSPGKIMAQYSHVISIILVAAAVCSPALTAPVTSSTMSVTAVDDQNGTSQIAVDNPLCFETGMRVLMEEGNARGRRSSQSSVPWSGQFSEQWDRRWNGYGSGREGPQRR